MSTMPAVRGLMEAPREIVEWRAPVAPSPAIRVQAISRPARTFTGDFYITHRHENRLWVALGDVAGKGLNAAVVMAMIQEELEHRIASCASAECDPARTAMRLHEFLTPLLPINRFATATIGWLDDDGTLTIVNAGHPPPLIVRTSGRIEEIPSTGPILGVLPNARWSSVQYKLAPGDALVLYSDGVSEAVVDGEELGVRGLRELLASCTSPDNVLAKLETADDVTLVVLSVR
jgi:sigma-B regulation protein RsbU (phosphoserine phosphatase)